MLRMIVPAVIGLTCLAGASSVEGGYQIDDFSQGTPFEAVYTSGLIDSQRGLDAQHVLGGQRLVFFPNVSPASGTARAALDTTQGHLILDSIQGGGLGGSGLTVQYGDYSAGGTDIGFDLT